MGAPCDCAEQLKTQELIVSEEPSMKAITALTIAGAVLAVAAAPPAEAQRDHRHQTRHEKDIVETAVSAGSFQTLVTAIKAAGLVEVLRAEGPFTVFAPTDDAFAKLPAGTLEALLEDTEQLTAVLTYHVVPGKVLAKDVMGLSSATTVQGSDLRIDTSDGVKVDNASVISTDVMASNGVIHVIDTVLIP